MELLDPERARKLIDMWSKGVPVEEIAKALGMKRTLVSIYARLLGLQPRGATKVDPDELRRLWEAGLSIREIARRLGVDESTVKRYLRAMGLRRELVSPCAAVDVEQLRKLCEEEGLSDEEIARRLNTSVWCVARLRRKYGIRRPRQRGEREVLDQLNRKGFVTSIELRERGIRVTKGLLRSLEKRGDVNWFKIVHTSTTHFSVLPARLSNVVIIYRRGREKEVARYLLQNIKLGVPSNVLKTLLKNNNVPQEIIDAVEELEKLRKST